MNISKMRIIDDNAYERGMARVKGCWPGISKRKRAVAVLEGLLEVTEAKRDEYKNRIDNLKDEVEELRKELAERPQDTAESTEPLIAQGLTVDGPVRISINDILVFQPRCEYTKETLREVLGEISKQTNMDVVLVDNRLELIGIIEHGSAR